MKQGAAASAKAGALQEQGRAGLNAAAAQARAQADALTAQGQAQLGAAQAQAAALRAQGAAQLDMAKAQAEALKAQGRAQIGAAKAQAEALAAEGQAQLDAAKAQAQAAQAQAAQADALKAQAQAQLDGVKAQAEDLKAKGQAQLDAAKAQALAQAEALKAQGQAQLDAAKAQAQAQADALKAQGQAQVDAAKAQALAQADAAKARVLGEADAVKAQALEQAEAAKAQALAQAEAAKAQALAQAEALKAEGQAQLDAAKAEAQEQAAELKAEAAGMAQEALGAVTSGLGGMFSGVMSAMTGAVVKAAEAAGLDGLAEQLVSAAEGRAVAFGESLMDDVTDAVEGAQRSASQRFRSGVARSLSMRARMRFGGGGEGEEEDGPSALTEGLQLYGETGKQRSLRADARDLVDEVAGRAEVREWHMRRSLPRSVLDAAARCGFGRLLVPKAQGGLGLTLDNTLPVFETIGAADLALAGLLAAHNAAAFLLATECTSKLHEKLLRQCRDLSSLAALAISEAPGGSDELSTSTYAEKDLSGQYYTLSGCKAWVAGAAAADVFLVLVRTGVEARRGLTLFTVTKGTPGVSVGKPQVLDGWRSTPVAPLSFNKVVARTECLVGREGHGLDILELAQDVQRVWLAAAAAAHGEAALSAAAAAVQSHPMGPVLGTSLDRPAHQIDVVKARTELQAARLMARAAAQQLDVKAPSGPADAAAAKVYAVRAAQRAVEAAVRIRGWDGLGAGEPAHTALANLQAADFVAGPPDALYGRIFGEVFRMVGP